MIDTSILLDCARRKLDVLGELGALIDRPFEAVVPSGGLAELERKAEEKGMRGADARFALKLMRAALEGGPGGAGILGVQVRVAPSEGHVDDWLFARAKELGADAVLCTSDAELRRKAKAAKLRTVAIMHNSKLGYG